MKFATGLSLGVLLGAAIASLAAGKAPLTQLDRIEVIAKAILVTQSGATFGKPHWNAFSAFTAVRREQPGYLDPGPFEDR